jgi:hypothetical protein
VTCSLPWLRFFVPSKAALTPVPAFALVTPLGNRTSGQTFRHLDPQLVVPGVCNV